MGFIGSSAAPGKPPAKPVGDLLRDAFNSAMSNTMTGFFGVSPEQPKPAGKAPPRTFAGDARKALADGMAAQAHWRNGGPFNPINAMVGSSQAIGGLIDAAGAAGGRHLYDLDPRGYSNAYWNALRLATTIGPNPNRPAFLDALPGPVKVPWKSPIQDVPAPMLTRQDAETYGEIAANALAMAVDPEDAVAEGARFAPRLADLALDAGRGAVRPLNNAVRDASVALVKKPVHMLDPEAEGNRLAFEAAMKGTQGEAEPMTTAAANWGQTGASLPSLMDVMSQTANGDDDLMGLSRAAAAKGGAARRAALRHQTDVAANFQGKVLDLTRGLAPDMDSQLGDLLHAHDAGQPVQDQLKSFGAGMSADLTEPAQTLASIKDPTFGRIGLRQNLLGRFKAGTTVDPDFLASVTDGDNARQILDGVYNETPAERYRSALRNEQTRLTNANRIAASVSTPARDVGAGLGDALKSLPTTSGGAAVTGLQTFATGLGLNPEEATAVVNRATAGFDPQWLAAQVQARQADRVAAARGLRIGLDAGVGSNAAGAVAPPRVQAGAPPAPDTAPGPATGASWPPFALWP